jgi:hypothetical protein
LEQVPAGDPFCCRGKVNQKMDARKAIERLDQVIAKGEAVLQTHRPPPPNVFGFPTLDSGAFTEWRSQALVCLEGVLGKKHTYVQNFEEHVKQGYQGQVKSGLGILRAA